MKPAISYGVVRSMFSSASIIEITSVTKAYYHGRTGTGHQTRGLRRSLMAEHPTMESAAAAIKRMRAVENGELPAKLKAARRIVANLEDEFRKAINAAAQPEGKTDA